MSAFTDYSFKNSLWPGRKSGFINYITNPPSSNYLQKLPRRLCVLGSTGSIGTNALSLLDKDFFSVRSLACGRNVKLLAQQAEVFKPPFLAVAREGDVTALAALLSKSYRPEILWGTEGFSVLAEDPDTDCVLSCQMGGIGLAGTLRACKAGKVIALANKESLVLAGGLLRKIAEKSGASILPVDSEHYAFFQCCAGREETPDKFLLTASGGPFLGKSKTDLQKVTPAQALSHPNWKMGKKISVDSATLMNKGLELIETVELYGISEERIKVLVHPQSIVHSLVQFRDNSLLGQFSIPDMKLPIAGCLYWPYVKENPVRELDLFSAGSLEFKEPDSETFPCLELARLAVKWPIPEDWNKLGLNPACIVLNEANEIAVRAFLESKCPFLMIAEIIEASLRALVFQNQYLQPVAGYSSILENGLANVRALELKTKQFISKNFPDLTKFVIKA